ncbi:TetR/AcrR family transcriptional regulator [Amycolatopsis magusensis]|uniref:DNA-binding transcriptional regulator YbjK n=1 Tax=Amycolatopsis magusensis TaxID=882444 RepID=A0ABS4Q0Z5_9PSEU|nr:TetR/AcrR family transcriptional regulator [Amycolatopsis magusensis]MBP2185248.1 DNA-binding transcriptional regulator YbjK [Amycolatopsis magusensis]
MPSPQERTRRDEVVEAAITVLGTQGARGLTHRAVDAEAGLPAGTTSNHFRTRGALLTGVLAGLAERDFSVAGEFADDGLAEGAARFARHMAGPDRVATLARYALFLEAAWDSQLRLQLEVAGARAAAPLRALLIAAGSNQPDLHAKLLLDHIEGMVLHELSRPSEVFRPEESLRLLVSAMGLGGSPSTTAT